ncbi:transmembrane protein 273 isoform X2 [Meriones unguiculatus]|uniref:transmembrane protein 273 isoform X2 n=1 Tax=Meriones unguiculatus TaxID=10047 RepID=UPI00293EDC4D|nr:transmembrane protein 273 isoform X2 [Meriones unguiculatus]
MLCVGGARVLATGRSAETEIDFKYAIIGMALGVAICAAFLALKICMIRRHLSNNDNNPADLKNAPQDTITLRKRSPSLGAHVGAAQTSMTTLYPHQWNPTPTWLVKMGKNPRQLPQHCGALTIQAHFQNSRSHSLGF